MTFADMPNGSMVFIDANTFVYHFTRHPQLAGACTSFLERAARDEVVALTSTHMLSEVAHRVMTIEAITMFGWPAAGIAQRLRRHPPTDVHLLMSPVRPSCRFPWFSYPSIDWPPNP